jgi:hypothetical protein
MSLQVALERILEAKETNAFKLDLSGLFLTHTNYEIKSRIFMNELYGIYKGIGE